MKIFNFLILSLAVMGSAALGGSLYAAEPFQVAEDHLGLAASYEQKAAAQDAVIAEHAQMKKDYKQRFFINEKVTPVEIYKKMERHCDAIIEAAQNMKADYLGFAKWHRMRAAELEGK